MKCQEFAFCRATSMYQNKIGEISCEINLRYWRFIPIVQSMRK